jgi:hypothetical protein
MKCCSFVCGLPSVMSGTKTLSSVEVNAVAPMMDKLKGNDTIWLNPDAEQFETAMRTVAHEMEKELKTNLTGAGAGAVVERPSPELALALWSRDPLPTRETETQRELWRRSSRSAPWT